MRICPDDRVILARRRGIAAREAAIADAATGEPLFWLDGTHFRDINGKIVGGRVSRDAEALHLSDAGARLMRGEDVGSGEKWPMPAEVRKTKEDGTLVAMADLAPGDVASGTAARAVFAPIPPQDHIADRVSPVCMIGHDRGSWWLENVADSIQQVLELGIAAGGKPPEIAPSFVNTPFTAPGYGLSVKLPIPVATNADFDLQLIALRRVTEGLRLAREVRVAKLLLATGSWAAANVLAVGATAKWNGGTTADPLAALFSAKATSALAATTLVMSEAVEPYFFSNTGTATTGNRVRDFVQAGGTLPKVLVGRARAMAAGAPSYVWGGGPASAVLIREVEDPRHEIGSCRTLRWNGEAPDGEVKGTDGFLVRRYRVGNSMTGADYVVAVHNDLEVMISNQVGSLITGALQ